MTLFKFSRLLSFVSKPIVQQKLNLSSEPQFLGIKSKYTDQLKFVNSDNYESIPIYRILSTSNEKDLPVKLEEETLIKMYKNMIRITVMDKILYESQRQGRISFYMTNSGEEAVQIGSASALTSNDVIYAQYREAGVLMWRGFKYSQFLNQCFSNFEDPGKGRQMPVHYGSKELNFMTVSSPLTTQMPQASGAAYALKLKKQKACVVCYFGDGGASEGDFHPALNFAATLDCPVIFICRNNGYAISTPVTEQYRGDGIAARGPAYGISTTRVDGNDILAVHHVTQAARDYCINNMKPVLIEAMTYRIGHHSTSDDSTAYRPSEEINIWTQHSPISRFRQYLEKLGLWSEAQETEFQKLTLQEFMKEFSIAEKKLKLDWREMFTDVYKEMPSHIEEQMKNLEDHLKKYGEHYPLKDYKST
ncbi:2-oxoisovalerate dehydrogenase subunit alpha, mitochondrial [Chelonus insularis]|uniref:2-oxoisovalerate dehydrogenase subunit alpha, mitochondrial n=1 Tax=Chelonus insularis TaxID=460826 RepID=UPI00158C0CBE|nr:2-oxoisovalerate dehydrogenase subunit alpha, mitochondrial [Chelonus insularis]